LLCELAVRLETVGHCNQDRYSIPIRQADLGSACGLTPEHTNRTLQELRSDGLIEATGSHLWLVRRTELASIGCFDPTYLQSHDAAHGLSASLNPGFRHRSNVHSSVRAGST